MSSNNNNQKNHNKKRPNNNKYQGGSRSKKDKKATNTWRRDFKNNSGDDNEDGKNSTTPHAGSFANPAMREQFGVVIDEELLNMSKNNDKDEADTSQTNNGDDNDNNDTNDKKPKKKVAMLLGFLGTNYGGFQVNEGQRTLQAEIELALLRCGMLSASNFGFPFKYGWSSSARTDKGVHAAAQVCSCKVELDENEWNEEHLEQARRRLNEALPSDIRVLDMDRVTRKFCAKTQRDRVRYQYMIPAFLLHSDWKGLLTENNVDMSVTCRDDGGDLKRPINDDDIKKLQQSLEGYRSTDESRKALKDALRRYEGTNFYHNFTRGLTPGQAQAQRYIESFIVQDPIVVENVEWIPTQVLGQSFLLHQIRKMIGVAVDVARGAIPLSIMDNALSKTHAMVIDVAPAQGLFLEMSYFGGYNTRKKQQNQDLNDLDWIRDGPANDRWSAFRDVVRSHIVQEEREQGNFLQYIYRHELVFDVRKEYGLDGNISTDATEHVTSNTENEASSKDG
ncbi:tRNA pseudouridine synthase A [Nitzschia inconspicua]|uniref:tRNA pseudouridine synthase A n=1 Tax=Nitzschia inconspicua TaxID=303405 RepID=A0A9K3LA72_9STRA|nr:tRNA pseudouridine synthase A [Nitzschia inconspicua]